MTIENLILGFAAVVVGLVLPSVFKMRFGPLILAITTMVVGVFGYGYFFGISDAGYRNWELMAKLSSGYQTADIDGLRKMVFDMSSSDHIPKRHNWTDLVVIFLVIAGGAATIFASIDLINKERLEAVELSKRESTKEADQ